jgi:membrane-associated phospholipid phosphatase
VVNGYDAFLEWTTGDWDPALRFWTLPFDPQLNQWLKAVDPSKPSILAAREFAGQYDLWLYDRAHLLAYHWLEADDLSWQPDPALKGTADWPVERDRAWGSILAEIVQLQQLMQDDRECFLAEIDVQADGLADYFIDFIGASEGRCPWTIELINCGLAIGNVAYMSYKQQFKRVRPSVLCPGLAPPFGPPAHPSFPSGHSFLGHFIALLLLEIPGLCQSYGLYPGLANPDGSLFKAVDPSTPDNPLTGSGPVYSPMLWLSQRLAKNRERLGVHYPSDSFGSRHLAAAIWRVLVPHTDPGGHAVNDPNGIVITCPTLETVLRHAKSEWPTKWPDPVW